MIVLSVAALATAGTVALSGEFQAPTTLLDFFQPGSQPSNEVVAYDSFRPSWVCINCHESDGIDESVVFPPWQGSMMAQSARDPLFYACLTIANQDAAFAGDLCLRCHTPGGWLSGRSEPSDGSALTPDDRDGVSCSVCHRMVDPVFKPGVSPTFDADILANISTLPVSPGGGNFIMDPTDVRRGPYESLGDVAPHVWAYSPFHRTPDLCATCHDVGNPALTRQPDDTYIVGPLDAAHEPGAGKYQMFSLERTYSEWLHSDFADGGVDMGDRYPGTLGIVSTCHDCHMPIEPGRGCYFGNYRDDLRSHELAGGNAWVQEMVWNLYGGEGLNYEYLQRGKAASVAMLQRASTVQAVQVGNRIDVRVINESGHKLPTGYPEGRRMWLNIEMFDAKVNLVGAYGAYDGLTADLTTADTKVYEAHLGLDAYMATVTGLPEGESFHFALNNKVLKDNRIPPRGFTNEAFRFVQAAPVAATYKDGQYWDDTSFRLMHGATSATINLYYQTASKEYVTFLRDENRTNDDGDVLYEQWEMTGMSQPVLMATVAVALQPFASGDYDGNSAVDLADAARFVDCLGAPDDPMLDEGCTNFDFDGDGDVDFRDAFELYSGFGPIE